MTDDDKVVRNAIFGGTITALLIVFAVCGGMYGCPQYGVYEKRLAGEAELEQAKYNERIAVVEAQAKLDSAALLAQSEVERAKGVAKANQIIGDSLKNNDAYLRYLWIDKLDQKGPVIYRSWSADPRSREEVT